MIIKILLILLLCVAFFSLVLLFSPMLLSVNSSTTALKEGSVIFCFAHPFILKILFSFASNSIELFLFSYRLYPFPKSSKRSGRPKPDKKIKETIAPEPDPEKQPSMPHIPELTPSKPAERESTQEEAAATDKHQSIDHQIEPPKDDDGLAQSVSEEREKIESAEEKPLKRGFGAKLKRFKRILQFIASQKKLAKKSISWITRILKSLFSCIKINRFSMQVTAGFEEPSVTGWLHGLYVSLFHALDLQHNRTVQLRFDPVFDNCDIVEISGTFQVRTSIFALILPLINALLFFPYFSAFILWRKVKRLKAELAT